MKFLLNSFLIVLIAILITSCKRTDDLVDFTIDEELLLGEKLAEVVSSSVDFSVISPESNSGVYDYVNSRLNEITSSTSLLKSDFNWTVTLLKSEDRSAFATPGGFIYINTGLIFFLENEDQFSGLIAHLIAHVDSTHVTERLFFQFGINNLKSIANGNDEAALSSVLNSLNPSTESFMYSRSNELEADEYSVSLLSGSGQSCSAAGLFFERMENVQPERQTFFLSIHSGTDTRVEDINEIAGSMGCDTSVDSESATRFQSFRNSIP
ncbi:M48 family metallopeptidase [Ekhidna sp.]